MKLSFRALSILLITTLSLTNVLSQYNVAAASTGTNSKNRTNQVQQSQLYSRDNIIYNAQDIKSEINYYVDTPVQLEEKVDSVGIVNASSTIGVDPNESRMGYSEYAIPVDTAYEEANENEVVEANTDEESIIHNDSEDEMQILSQSFNENMQQWAKIAEAYNPSANNNMTSASDTNIKLNRPSMTDFRSNMETSLVNSSSSFYKLAPEYFNTNFTFEMMSATVTYDEHNFKNIGNFRSLNDLCGMTWETVDTLSHKDLRYPTNCDFTGVRLQYDYYISGDTAYMNSDICPTLTIITNDGNTYYVRLWNYVVNRPLDDWEYNTDIRFPAGRTEGDANGISGTIKLDFDNLYAGWAPVTWELQQEIILDVPVDVGKWVENPAWVKVPVNNIKKIMWSFIPKNYNYQLSGELAYYSDSYEYEVDFSNWYVSGNTYLGQKPSVRQMSSIRICDDYDDIYNMTPERVVNEYSRLGYGGIVNFYVGASHYYDKKYSDGDMVVKEEYPFNFAFETWYKDYLRRLSDSNTEVISSISMESVDAPNSWWQLAYDGTAATTGWTPTPHLLSFVNYDVKMYYKSLVLNLARLSVDQGLVPKIQLGEPWWWFIERDSTKIPCFYDSATRYQFKEEMGYDIPVFETCYDTIQDYDEVLYWLQEKNGEFSIFLRDELKQCYSSAQFSVLFFPPSVIDKDRIPMMMSIVNFPKNQWKYPNLDFFMLEDYDYLIEGSMDKHEDALTFVQRNLGYPKEKIHYFSGFVLNDDKKYVWNNINQALNDGFNQGFAEIYVWAYAQVKRDGWDQPDIIMSNHPSGNYPERTYFSFSCDGSEKLIFTTDGTTPSLSNGLTYNAPLCLMNSTTIKLVAVKNGVLTDVMSFHYTIPMVDPHNTTLLIDGITDDWNKIDALCIGSGNIFDLTSVQDSDKLYLLARGTHMNTSSNFYIDIDQCSSTGYHVWAWSNSGADYMLQDKELYKYSGSGDDWSWTKITTATVSKTYYAVEASIKLSDINLTESKEIMIAYSRNYEDFAPMTGGNMANVNTLVINSVTQAEEIWVYLEMIDEYQAIIDAPIISLLDEETPTTEDVEKYKINLRHTVQYLQIKLLENPLVISNPTVSQFLAQNIIDGNGISSIDNALMCEHLKASNYIIEKIFDEYAYKQWLECTSLLLNLVPIIGSAKAIAEGIVGYDLITGRQLAWWERAINIPLGAVSLVGEVGLLAVAFKDTRLASTLSHYATIAGNTAVKTAAEALANAKYTRTLLLGTRGFMDDMASILDDIGMSSSRFNQLRSVSADTLSSADRTAMKAIRDGIPMPTNVTIMQKVIPQGDIAKYLDGTYNQVGGYVTKAQDVKQLTSYDDIFNSLRLDYFDSAYKPATDECVGVIRFKTAQSSEFKIPYSEAMGGNTVDGAPFTGNGFTAATNGQAIPEYTCNGKYLSLEDGAELYTIAKDGTETLAAVYDSYLGKFVDILQ